jgi:hypothetical protein
MTRIITSVALTFAIGTGSYFVNHPNHCSGESIPAAAESSTPSTAPRYYAIVYSYQDAENHVMKSHTFAQFIKVNGDDPATAKLETRTISWLPARFAESFRLTVIAVPGKNFTLAETMKFAEHLGTTVKHFEPIEIDAATYEQAVHQIERLNAGGVRYKMYNSSSDSVVSQSTGGVSHCIHAVGDVCGRIPTGVARGFEAGGIIHDHIAKHGKTSQAPAWLYEVAARTPETIDRPAMIAASNAR